MVRTAAVRVSAGKSSKKSGGGAHLASTSTPSKLAGSAKSTSSLPPITHQETPAWQKPITNFFRLNALKSIENENKADSKEENVHNIKNESSMEVDQKEENYVKEKENKDKRNEENENPKDEENISGPSKKKKKRFMNLKADSSDDEELEKMRSELQEKLIPEEETQLDGEAENESNQEREVTENDEKPKKSKEMTDDEQPGSSKQ